MHTLLLLLLTAAHAQDADVLGRHVALGEQSMKAERAGDYDAAWAACAEAVNLLPEGPRAQRCGKRLAFLDVRRDADGTFASWAELEAVRRDRRALTKAEARGRVVALLAREGVAGTTLAEATLWLASENLDLDGDPQRALDTLAPLYATRDGLEDGLRKRAVMLQARALAELGRTEEALGVEEEIHVTAPMPRRTPVQTVARAQQVARWSGVAWGVVAAFVLVSAPLAVRGLRRPPVPLGLVPIWASLGAAWWLAESWESGAGASIAPMGAGLTAIHLVAVLARTVPAPPAWRAVVSATAALATGAVAWLALTATGSLGWVGQ